MTPRSIVIWIILALFFLLGVNAVRYFIALDRYPDLERDARRLGVYLVVRERCLLPSPAGGVDSVSGRYDFDPLATEAFGHALTMVKREEAARVAALSEAEMSSYCERAAKDLPWTVPHE